MPPADPLSRRLQPFQYARDALACLVLTVVANVCASITWECYVGAAPRRGGPTVTVYSDSVGAAPRRVAFYADYVGAAPRRGGPTVTVYSDSVGAAPRRVAFYSDSVGAGPRRGG